MSGQIPEIFDTASAFVALAAFLGALLLLPLYVSQRRDVRRMRAWMEREPEHPAEDIAASEALLDRAERELEELLGEPGPEPEPVPETAEATAVSPATRVTHDRPALERITMERAALAPHPRWRRFVARATQTRVLIALGAIALVAGIGAIFVSEGLLSEDPDRRGPNAKALDPADIQVAILNGTSINGLAADVGSDLESAGYPVGPITSAEPGVRLTTVMFADGQKRAAQKVARELGRGIAVEPLDAEAEGLSEGADVVVIAGEDEAS